ncbi:hypothetical protein Afil01_55490 [Actinorhabdospora filicis]|uniref:Phosphatase n=1 Tax=Actinorhabdospora filicis TaxID=1785913 RepID=A0A9W6SR87_9ACTN|nr:PhoX family phosphatase [Actinorhabdospora filicis]GLZ80742.1 hypothetical protein Afil01_55490 [Actinorhabdospora filicis]
MTVPERRRLLPLFTKDVRHANRSSMTCRFRCGNACDHPVPNQSGNEYLGDIVTDAVASRRGVLRAGAIGAAVFGAAAAGVASATPAFAGDGGDGETPQFATPEGVTENDGRLTFRAVPPNTIDAVITPNGYDHAVVIEWGDKVVDGAPDFDIDNQSARAQKRQFGYNNDFVGVLPWGYDEDRALLVANHEYTNEVLMFRGYTTGDVAPLDQIEIAMAAHGMSVVGLSRVEDTGQWKPSRNRRYNRRIHVGTKFEFTGPARGSALLKTAADTKGTTPVGTLNNCSGGVTPWGTVLSGEENFNQYFTGGDGVPADQKPFLVRYGIDTGKHHAADNRRFDRVEERFDLTKHPHEANRFGWIVEIDPYNPDSTPRKHTALGRFKHEGANAILAKDGRAVVYMGDDERFDYMYKFVSERKFAKGNSRKARENNLRLLESGTLYVAKLGYTSAAEIDGTGKLPADGQFNGTGRWIPLVRGTESLVPGMSVEEILVHTRLAGDAVGATKMDRPEDVQPNPKTGKIYAALTNNTDRGKPGKAAADEANPRNLNKHGQIIEITEDNGEQTSETFTWDLPIVCGDPKDPSTFFAGFDKTKVSPISCPDNVAFDASGKNLWISTDGNQLGANDGLFAVPLTGPERGFVKQFLSVPFGAETCGPWVTDDTKSVFVAVQHPGEVTGASVDNPASTWPNGDYGKPAVVCAWRIDGRDVGV